MVSHILETIIEVVEDLSQAMTYTPYPTILCVEDDENTLNIYKKVFLPQNSCKILFIKKGSEAISTVKKYIRKGKNIPIGFFNLTMAGSVSGWEAMMKVLSLNPYMRCVLVCEKKIDHFNKIISMFRSDDQWFYLKKPFAKFEIRQIALNLISSWQQNEKKTSCEKDLFNSSLLFQKENLLKGKLKKKENELKIINDIGKKINSVHDINMLLKKIIYEASVSMKAVIGSLLLLDNRKKKLIVKAAYGPLSDNVFSKVIPVNKHSISGYVLLSKNPLLINNMDIVTRFRDSSQQRKICDSLISVPLKAKDRIIGVMHLGRNKDMFNMDDLSFFATLSDQAAIAIENARLHKSINDSHFQIIQALASAIDEKDSYTRGHSDRLTEYAIKVAEELNLPEKEVNVIRQAGLLHDIGKIGISESILNKNGKLTKKEFREIKKHPAKGASIISPVSFYPKVATYIRHHHERYDGNGYPDKISGDNIPLGSRILSVADSFDAMTSDRCYRKGFSKETALGEIQKCAGSQFDPDIAEVFISVVKRELQS